MRFLMIGMDDWEGLYIEGRLFDEHHQLDTEWVISLLDAAAFMGFSGIGYRDTFYDHEEDHPLSKYEPFHRFPKTLSAEDFEALWEKADDTPLQKRAFRALTEFINEGLS